MNSLRSTVPVQLNFSLKNTSNDLTTLRYSTSINPSSFGMNLTVKTLRKWLPWNQLVPPGDRSRLGVHRKQHHCPIDPIHPSLLIHRVPPPQRYRFRPSRWLSTQQMA